ncbi:hypothetical protein GCM10027615_06760 [Plantactinospora veratri]
MITTSPRTPNTHPRPVSGGFSDDRHPVAGVPRFPGPTPAVAYGAAQFLAPSTAAEEKPAPRVSDCGEVAMRRLRHPFTITADATPHRTTAAMATQVG